MNKSDYRFPNDEIFTTSIRLTIMLLLHSHKKVLFSELQKLLQLTPGNLDHHIKTLENANYVKTYKKLSFKRPLTVIEITVDGKEAFGEYIDKIRHVLSEI